MHRTHQVIEYETMLLGRHRLRTERGRLDRSAYIVLSRILLEGPMSIGQLSEAFGLDPSTLNRQTSAMLRAGLLERIPDPEGGIARKFRVTQEGERLFAAEREKNTRGLERVTDGWSREDLDAFAAYLRRFNGDIEQLEGRTWPRPNS
ncbi:MAG: MarR family transcriptional regulator [Nonomuraea sp.]|nr:MarR family transcriptional regulator [Nonomuraea sp.]